MAVLQRAALPATRKIGRWRPRWLLGGTLALVVLAAGLQVNQFSRLTSTGYQLNELNRQRAARQAENHELEAEVARLSSLGRVDWEARTRLHMVPASQRLYLNVNHAAPDRQSLPTRFLPPEASTAKPGTGTPWWKQILELAPF